MPYNPKDPASWNLVIADDEPDSIAIIELVFESLGARIRTASSGQRCLQLLDEEAPHLLFLDVQMPEISGWEVVKRIRSSDALRSIIVIATTAKAMSGDRERVLKGGFDAYLSKPLSPLTIVADVTEVLLRKQAQTPPDTQPDASPAPADSGISAL